MLQGAITSTEYLPDVKTVIDCEVAPVDQRYVGLSGAVNTTESPWQKVNGPSGVIIFGVSFRTIFTFLQYPPESWEDDEDIDDVIEIKSESDSKS